MITRRNWLLRCSILINIAVLLYICSQMMIADSDPNSSSASSASNLAAAQTEFLLRQQQQQAQQAQQPEAAADNGQRDLLQDAADQQQQQQFQDDPDAFAQAVADEARHQLLLQQQQQLQLQQQQQQQSHDSANELIVDGGDDNRFEVPSDSEHPEVAVAVAAAEAVIGAIGAQTGGAEAAQHGEAAAVEANNSPEPAAAVAAAIPLESETERRLRQLHECHNRPYAAETVQRGDFWVLRNYIRAEHGELRCFETLTYTTHADYTFLDNLIPLLQRWQAPISIAMHAPGTDFAPTVRAIRYLRDCAPGAELVRLWATFHMYFSSKHIPKVVPREGKALEQLAAAPFNCSLPAAYVNVTAGQLYKTQKKLLYPVNVGRNVARDAALTHFVLASDIELYPNPGLPAKFLEMMARNEGPLRRPLPKVWPLSIFEVDQAVQVPRDKTELLALLKRGKAIPFHKRVCASCHGVPKSKEWMAANETEELGIFHVGKRVGYFVHWEPIYIGTHADPHYDERLSWEGKSDKMTQGYALCALDYEFQILDNAFLVHKPGIKVLKKDTKRAMLAAKTNNLIRKIIYPELQVMYGVRKGCTV